MNLRTILCLLGLAIATACEREPAAAPAPAPEAAGLIEIPVSPGREAATDVDMRALEPFVGDLDTAAERGVIRILVAPSRTHFDRGQSAYTGRTVDAAIVFEQFVNGRLKPRMVKVVLIPADETSMMADLLAGRADIAANVRRTFERDDQAAFAKPWRTGVREIVVTGPGVKPLVSLEDVGGRVIHVRRDSDHHASLMRLNEQLQKINRSAATIMAVDSTTDEDLLAEVNRGGAPATIVDDYIYDRWRAGYAKTAANRDVAVSQDGELAWVVRKDAPKLLAVINEFFATHRLAF